METSTTPTSPWAAGAPWARRLPWRAFASGILLVLHGLALPHAQAQSSPAQRLVLLGKAQAGTAAEQTVASYCLVVPAGSVLRIKQIVLSQYPCAARRRAAYAEEEALPTGLPGTIWLLVDGIRWAETLAGEPNGASSVALWLPAGPHHLQLQYAGPDAALGSSVATRLLRASLVARQVALALGSPQVAAAHPAPEPGDQ